MNPLLDSHNKLTEENLELKSRLDKLLVKLTAMQRETELLKRKNERAMALVGRLKIELMLD